MSGRQLEITKKIREYQSLVAPANLIAVTKYSPVEDVYFAYEAMQFDFGENRVLDLKEKAQWFVDHNLKNVRWHFIGHLQSNKVKELLKIPHLVSIHSIDSIKLLEEIYHRSHYFEGEELKLFLQVNTSKEDEKSGFENVDELKTAIDYILKQKNAKIKLAGLMTMATIRTAEVEKEANRCFSELRNIKENLEHHFHLKDLQLSMGMSNDFKIALKHHTNFVRIGSSIFQSHT